MFHKTSDLCLTIINYDLFLTFRKKALITENQTNCNIQVQQSSPKESLQKKPSKPPLPNRPKDVFLPKVKAVEKSDDQNKGLQITDTFVDDTENVNPIVVKQGPKKPPPPKIQSPRSSIKKPLRPPIPKSPSLKSKEKPPPPVTITNAVTPPMESNSPQSPPTARPRPTPRPRVNGDRPVPLPRRQTSKNESEENELKQSKEILQNETLSLSDQLLRETSKQNSTEDNPVNTASDKLSEEKHNVEIVNFANVNINSLNTNTENSVSPPKPPSEHKVVVKQKSRSPGPYENINKLDLTKNFQKKSPYENVKLNEKKNDEAPDNESIYSAPKSLDQKVDNNLFDRISKPIHIKEIEDDIYDVPPTSISPVKSHKQLTKAISEPMKSQNKEENIYAAPTSPHTTISSNHDLRFDVRQQAPNQPTLSRITQKPTPLNPGTPVIPYSMLRDSVNNDQSQMDDAIMYSNIEEEALYSAPPSTPIKVPDIYTVEKPRSISQLSSNATMSPRDSMSSGSSRGSSSISENAMFMQEGDTDNVPNTLKKNTNTFIIKDTDAMNTFRIKGDIDIASDYENDDENEYSSLPSAVIAGSYRDSKYVDMSPGGCSPIFSPPTKPPRPSSVTRPGSEYESIDFGPSSPTKSTGTITILFHSHIYFSVSILRMFALLIQWVLV